ncbi:MAG: hypothetical protein RJB39_631 [Candidatus Parcubacteria bacterium]|jgi:RsiW-degrading membrane proteinase PrsW (M82 family)
MNSFLTFFYIILGGLVPALFWMWFWMHEENRHNEPKRTILLTFIFGMVAVLISYFAQKGVALYFHIQLGTSDTFDLELALSNHPVVSLIYVMIEEMTKFFAAYVIAFHTKWFREPIDAFIYLMTAALGFAAMENTLFYMIMPMLSGSSIQDIIVVGHTRFIGSSVLHVASSGLLAVFIGLSFCKSPVVREFRIWLGMLVAIAVHWIFNVLLIVSDDSRAFLIFGAVWVVTIFLIISLERVKQIKCF